MRAAQKKVALSELIKETKGYLAIYEELTPLGNSYYSLRKLPLSNKELGRLTREVTEAGAFTKRRDSVMHEIAIPIMQQKITRNIQKMIEDEDLANYDLHVQFANTGLTVAVAPDKKLYNFSFDAKNGGSYRMSISLVHYTGLDPRLARLTSSLEEKPAGPYVTFRSDGYDRIDTISSTEGTKYVLTSTVRACNLCFVSTLDLVSFRDSAFVQEFSYSVELRTWEETIKYDSATRTITVAYQTDDLTRTCGCGVDRMDNEEDTTDDKDLPHRLCECMFRYDGVEFKLIKQCSELLEAEQTY